MCGLEDYIKKYEKILWQPFCSIVLMTNVHFLIYFWCSEVSAMEFVEKGIIHTLLSYQDG